MTFLLVVVIVVLLVGWWNLRNQFQQYDARIAELTRRIWILENMATKAPASAPAQAAEPIPVLPPPPPLQGPAQPMTEGDPAPPEPLPLPIPPPPPAEPARPLAEILGIGKSEEWETFIGGSLLNKAGALILVVGIALFLAYSFGHLTAAGRAGIALALSSLLLAAGIVLEHRGKYAMFARGLIGAGWAALYATSYAIYALPAARIIDDPFVGSLVMLAVAAAMVAHSLSYRSQAVTAVAFFAAFAALAATPNSPFAVISLIPLAAAVLFLASRFEWYWLPLFGLAATYLTCISRGSSNASLAETQGLFLVYWILFEGFDMIRTHRRILAEGLHLVSPLNTFFFLGISYFTWGSHDPSHLWRAAAYAAALFLADVAIRAYLRPPSSFAEGELLVARLKAGSYEAPLVIAAALAALSIVGRVPETWSSAALAVEAEVLYLAGLQLSSPFLRAVGFGAFAFSLGDLFWNSLTPSRTTIFGHSFSSWTPAALFHAALFYGNRAIRKPNAIFSAAATTLIAAGLAIELPEAWVGASWLIFGAILFELKEDFRQQGYIVLMLGAVAALVSDIGLAPAPVAPLAISLAVAYQAALRPNRQLQIGATAAAALFSALLIYRLVPTPQHGIAWMALSILFLLHERFLELHEFRVAGIGLAALAFLSTTFHNIDPPALALAVPVVAGLYAAQLLMEQAAIQPEGSAFSVAGTLLLMMILYGRVSGGLVTLAWAGQGLALLIAGFPLRQRILRIEGLILLGICVLKLFLYDLRNLETLYRILSFVALGIILLGVSWIYTRFQDQIKKLL